MPRDERIVTLDLLRGLALLGILLANMSVFGQPQASTAAFSATYDRVADWMTEFLIHGKFNAIFSFLFGYGFTLWMDRGGGQGQAGFALYLRRLLVLFVIGASHYVLLWDGDILHKYALLGVLLLALRRLRWQDTPLLLLAGLLLCADLGHQYVTQYFGLSSSPMRGDPAVQAQEELQRLSAGPYREQVTARLESFRQLYAPGARAGGGCAPTQAPW